MDGVEQQVKGRYSELLLLTTQNLLKLFAVAFWLRNNFGGFFHSAVIT